jgi:hypothetical protein
MIKNYETLYYPWQAASLWKQKREDEKRSLLDIQLTEEHARRRTEKIERKRASTFPHRSPRSTDNAPGRQSAAEPAAAKTCRAHSGQSDGATALPVHSWETNRRQHSLDGFYLSRVLTEH